MRTTEIGKIFKLHPSTIKRWIKLGYLKGNKVKPEKGIGGHEYWDISKKDLQTYLDKLNQ